VNYPFCRENSNLCGGPEHDHEGLLAFPRYKTFITPQLFTIMALPALIRE